MPLGLESIFTNPWLFAAGAAAVSVPIIIHLLNKRRFKVVDWAAMDFLLDADKKNRRRIRLENLLLLLLRCLAVLLIALLLGRPFLPTSMTAGLIDAAQFERIVVLDDSLSMQARLGNESLWEIGRKQLVDLVRGLGEDPADNSLTLIRMSQPDKPILNGLHLSGDNLDEAVRAIEQLEATDRPANLSAALQQLDAYLANQPANINRVVYLVSDLRDFDWRLADEGAEAPAKILARLSKETAGCFLLDAGSEDDQNLAIREVRPEGTLVEGVPARFDVSVKNASRSEAKEVRVKLTAGDALPLENLLERIAPGETVSTSFSVAFTRGEEEEATTSHKAPALGRKVRIEVIPADQGESDKLLADNTAYFPARVVKGIPTVLVDGDPSAAFGKAETFYLRRALAPSGQVPSGVSAQIVTENELESLSLDGVQVIFLCNIYRLGEKSAENLQRLQDWVSAGGGLVLLPGDQIDEQFFNDQYYKDGAGLSPVRLVEIRGDETEQTWATLKVEQAQHEVLKIFAGQNNPFLDNVKTFRWWATTIAKEQLGGIVNVPARLNDADESPWLAEKAFGKGRVVALCGPGDADWSNWSSDPSFVIAMQELVRYLSSERGDQGVLRVGQPIVQPLDLAEYEVDVALTGPRGVKANIQAAPVVSEKPATTPNSGATVWTAAFEGANAQGFYELALNRREGGAESVLFAANVDPDEGNLARVDSTALKRSLGDANVKIVPLAAAADLTAQGAQTELWWYILWTLIAVLCIEQTLGWYFGLGR